MENKMIDLETFKKDNFSKLSPFFITLFEQKIGSVSISENQKIVTYVVNLDEKFSNPFGKIHGGAIGTLIENLSNSSLRYFTKKNFYTIDFNISYISTVDYNKDIQVIVNCLRSQGLTSFVDVEIKEKDAVLIKAFLIKTAISEKF